MQRLLTAALRKAIEDREFRALFTGPKIEARWPARRRRPRNKRGPGHQQGPERAARISTPRGEGRANAVLTTHAGQPSTRHHG
jgi:hypothetical protein